MVRWFVNKGIASNLLMMIIIVMGVFSVMGIKRELFPDSDSDLISIVVPYPGATPKEVEEGICVRIEEEIYDLEGIKTLQSSSMENAGMVVAEVEKGYDFQVLMDEIKIRVDSISTFPKEAEKSVVEKIDIGDDLLIVAVTGDLDERSFRVLTEKIRAEIIALPGISVARIDGIRDYEISIDVSESTLRKFNLTFDDVVRSIRSSSIDLPAGTIKASAGEILLRSKGQSYYQDDFESIVLLRNEDGSLLRLGDVASVNDGFKDESLYGVFNEKPSAMITVSGQGSNNIIEISETVRAYVDKRNLELPEEIRLTIWGDGSFYLSGRLQLLINNGLVGLLLVFIVLALFLRPSLAFWVTMGIPISFLGAFILMPMVGVTINLISLFGLIMVLGIIVDDAIVVGESVFSYSKQHGFGRESSIIGTEKVSVPVTFAVLTTMVAFVPILFLPGFMGKIMYPIPIVVIIALFFSLIESKFILPYHLSSCRPSEGKSLNRFSKIQRNIADGLERFIENIYQPFLGKVLLRRYLTLSIFIGLLIMTIGYVKAGWLQFEYMPKVPSDYIVTKINMVEGMPVAETERAVQRIKKILEIQLAKLEKKHGARSVKNTLVTIGSQPFKAGPSGSRDATVASHLAEIVVEMVPSEERSISSPELARIWRESLPPLLNVKHYTMKAYAAGGIGSPIDVEISGDDIERMTIVANLMKDKLKMYNGLIDFSDNYTGGKREIQIKVKPEGELLGITQIDIARQVRQAFYGEEVQRIQRGRSDIRVMARYPLEERVSPGNLDDMRIRTKNGDEVSFHDVASVTYGRGTSKITRVDRRRVINVTADADKSVAKLEDIKKDLIESVMPAMMKEFDGIRMSLEGQHREQSDAMGDLRNSVIFVLCVIFALMAIPFNSYVQPLIIMCTIPFGLIGAIMGHVICMKPLSFLSILGILALMGVIVNDSLVLVDYINKKVKAGIPIKDAVWTAGAARFRPILLTSLTTFAGLTPILLERSLQAQFLIPMAISLGFGILFATFITLLLVPVAYLVLEDVKGLFIRKK